MVANIIPVILTSYVKYTLIILAAGRRVRNEPLLACRSSLRILDA